jgi:hypothetical protein
MNPRMPAGSCGLIAERQRGDRMNETDALTPEELEELAWAKKTLLSPDLTGRIGDVIGRPLENGLNMLPKRWRDIVDKATEAALYKGLEFALSTMGERGVGPARNRLHKVVVAGSGVVAGAAGLYALAVELPFSTCVMLRSIADIAREGIRIEAEAVGLRTCLSLV